MPKNAALALVARRMSTRTPRASTNTAVSATGIAEGENAYTADGSAGMNLGC
jgi:hypothetical protein